MESNLPTQRELHEFRNVIALARAHHNGQGAELRLLNQLVEYPAEHLHALRALIHILLCELDSSKRDANEVLTFLVENSACADAQLGGPRA